MASQSHFPGRRSPNAPARPVSVRERILQTARDSFYREGVRAVGVDTLIARSGVAKMSFYRSFRSKDDLVCAYLESSAAEYWQWWDEIIRAHPQAPRKTVAGVVSSRPRIMPSRQISADARSAIRWSSSLRKSIRHARSS